MKAIEELTSKELLSDDVFEELFSETDEITKARLLVQLSKRAEELKVTKYFNTILRGYKKAEKDIKNSKPSTSLEGWTNFDGPYDNMKCRQWIATDDGIYTRNSQNGISDIMACYHPILPIERLRNLETGEEQIKIAFKRNGRWTEFIAPKTMVSSASKIVNLSARGVSVTSENAKQLVRFLADVENANDDYINVIYSTAKLGWTKTGSFLPYDTDIVFDGNVRFNQLIDSIRENGDRDIWFNHVLELRKSDRFEAKFMMSVSFSSVLVKFLNGLPFFVDLWGDTEGGKTVTLMLAASIWANPGENAYIGDYKSTAVGLEQKADMLNNLPLMLDDTSQKDKKIEEGFETIIYNLCSGKGKTRSNKELGLNRENRWSNCFLSTGERPLTSYVSQGGAINRVLEVECKGSLFEDPGKTAELLKQHYGFAGKEFVEIVKSLGAEKIKQMQQEFIKQLSDSEKMQKQSLSLSIIMTADKIVTDYLFKDGRYSDFNRAKDILISKNELSDNERCYQYLLGKITMNPARFDLRNEAVENWGIIEDDYAVIQANAFNQLCESGKFSRTSFLSWASENNLLKTDKGRQDKLKKFKGIPIRCVFLKLKKYESKEEFMEVEEYEQAEIPFN